MKKIMNLSRFLKWVALIIIILLPVMEAGYWITEGYPFFDSFYDNALPKFGDEIPITWAGLDPFQRFLGFLINLLPLSFSIAALANLARLFDSFQRGRLFERKNVRFVKRAGWMLIIGQLIYPLYCALLSMALTFQHPVGHRMISVALRSDQFEITLIGIAVLLVASLLDQAAKLQEDQEATI